MFLSDTDKELISKLKGRLSKALNIQTKLNREEKICMEGIYEALDGVILGKKYAEEEEFSKALLNYLSGLKSSRRKYVKEHIVPLVNKIATKKWSDNE